MCSRDLKQVNPTITFGATLTFLKIDRTRPQSATVDRSSDPSKQPHSTPLNPTHRHSGGSDDLDPRNHRLVPRPKIARSADRWSS